MRRRLACRYQCEETARRPEAILARSNFGHVHRVHDSVKERSFDRPSPATVFAFLKLPSLPPPHLAAEKKDSSTVTAEEVLPCRKKVEENAAPPPIPYHPLVLLWSWIPTRPTILGCPHGESRKRERQ